MFSLHCMILSVVPMDAEIKHKLGKNILELAMSMEYLLPHEPL